MIDVKEVIGLDGINCLIRDKEASKAAAAARYSYLEEAYKTLDETLNSTDVQSTSQGWRLAYCQLDVAFKRTLQEELKIMTGATVDNEYQG